MPSRKPLQERFWDHVSKGTRDECWLWTASLNKQSGYGNIAADFDANNGQVMLRAHRVSWEIHNGPVPEGKCVLHKCDTPYCVNPYHLFLGTQKDNSRDMVNKGRGWFQKDTKAMRQHLEKMLAASAIARRGKQPPQFTRYRAEHPDWLKGEQSPLHKLTESDVLEIRRLKSLGLSLSKLGKMFCIDPSAVSLIVNHKRWTYLAYREQPADDKPTKGKGK